MNTPYEDILYLPRPVSAKRQRMTMEDRAAQFSPFAALTGHDAAIRETARLTDARIELAEDELALLNDKLVLLAWHQERQPEVTVTYFVQDERKQGGAYVTARARVRRVDPRNRALLLEGERTVWFECIYELKIPDDLN